MSQSDFTLNLLGITDEHISVTNVTDTWIGVGSRHRKVKLIKGQLTYQPPRCPNCGFNQMIKYGFHTASFRIPSTSGWEFHLRLRKQRFLCHQCQATCDAHSPVLEPNHTMSQGIHHRIIQLAKDGLTLTEIGKLLGVSITTVSRLLYGHVQRRRTPSLPSTLCFDEFRSANHQMSFISCDAISHKLTCLLHNRQTETVVNYFLNRYSLAARQQVQFVVIDLNAQYQQFIHRIFPNAKVIIDRFHLIQLAGKALDQARLNIVHRLEAHHSRIYRILKSQWKLFHKVEIDGTHVHYFRGLNEYTTQQNCLDLVFDQYPEFEKVYQAYTDLVQMARTKQPAALENLLHDYRPTQTIMDTVIHTIKRNLPAVKLALSKPYSNGPLEGINNKIKVLKRSSYGFRNLSHFFIRIELIHG